MPDYGQVSRSLQGLAGTIDRGLTGIGSRRLEQARFEVDRARTDFMMGRQMKMDKRQEELDALNAPGLENKRTEALAQQEPVNFINEINQNKELSLEEKMFFATNIDAALGAINPAYQLNSDPDSPDYGFVINQDTGERGFTRQEQSIHGGKLGEFFLGVSSGEKLLKETASKGGEEGQIAQTKLDLLNSSDEARLEYERDWLRGQQDNIKKNSSWIGTEGVKYIKENGIKPTEKRIARIESRVAKSQTATAKVTAAEKLAGAKKLASDQKRRHDERIAGLKPTKLQLSRVKRLEKKIELRENRLLALRSDPLVPPVPGEVEQLEEEISDLDGQITRELAVGGRAGGRAGGRKSTKITVREAFEQFQGLSEKQQERFMAERFVRLTPEEQRAFNQLQERQPPPGQGDEPRPELTITEGEAGVPAGLREGALDTRTLGSSEPPPVQEIRRPDVTLRSRTSPKGPGLLSRGVKRAEKITKATEKELFGEKRVRVSAQEPTPRNLLNPSFGNLRGDEIVVLPPKEKKSYLLSLPSSVVSEYLDWERALRKEQAGGQ